MTNELETWLKQAACGLSKDSSARVRAEIDEHYVAAREAAMNAGSSDIGADRAALSALGSARAANRQYRKVLLTSAEARILRESNWEASVVCSRVGLKWTLLAIPVTALCAAVALFLNGEIAIAKALLVGALGIGLVCAAPFLPIYTPVRGRVFRVVKWIALTAVLALAFGDQALKLSWLLASCVWPMAWIEWTRFSIRRKLPVAQWPKQLYL